MTKINFSGVLTTTAGLHVSDPDTWYLDKRGRFTKTKGDTLPVTRTMLTPFVFPAVAENLDPEDDMSGMEMRRNVQHLPFFPANDLAGRIRRKAAKRVLSELRDRNEMVTLDIYRAMTTGSVTGTPKKQEPESVSLYEKVRNNLFVGVFGGGPRIFPRGYACSDLTPITVDLVDAGISSIPDAIGVAPVMARHARDITGVRAFFHIDDTLRYIDADLRNVVKDYDESVRKWQEITMGEKTAKSNADGEPRVKREKVSNMGAFEFIAPGVPLDITVTPYDYLSDGQVGLLLYAIMDLANEQSLGGLVRHKFGQFNLQLEAFINGEWRPALVYDEELNEYHISEELEFLEEACLEALSKFDVAELAELYKD